MVQKSNSISAFISIPDIFLRKHLSQKKNFLRKDSLISKKETLGNIVLKGKPTEQNEWLDSILSVRNISDEKYLNKWRKVGVNLIKSIPFPSKSDESWKLTSMDKIFEMRFSKNEKKNSSTTLEKYIEGDIGPKIVFVNGLYSKSLSDLSSLDKKIFLGDLKEYKGEETDNILEFLSKGESGINGGFFPTLNIACLSDIYVLSIPSKLRIDAPINIFYIGCNDSNTSLLNHRLVVISGEDSKANVIEHHVGTNNSKYFDNTAVSILTKEGSTLDFYLINDCSPLSTSINSIHAEIKDFSNFNFSTISLGGLFNRVNLGIDINGTECQCNVKGASIAKNSQISDFHSRISHNLPGSKSSQLQKILLTDKAHGIFAGKIQLQHGAGNTKSDQLCKTLLLSPNSRIDALPILEINNENVKCTHGSTVSDLDKNQMFYLQSRGITGINAKKLLTIGFINEMIDDYPLQLKSKISQQFDFLM